MTVYRDFDPGVPYSICNKITNMCLEVKAWSTAAGGLVDLYPWTCGNNQKWYFQRVNTNSHDGNYRMWKLTLTP